MLRPLLDAIHRAFRRSAAAASYTRQGGSKHLPFFKLTEACESDRCPICRLRQDALAGYLDALVYQGVNDRGFRAEFDRNGGFCSSHEHAFLAKQDRLAVVITHRQLLLQLIDDIGTPHRRRCQICSVLSEAEAQHLKTLAGYLDDAELRRYLERSAGLCVPHYRKLARIRPDLPGWLNEMQRLRLLEAVKAVDEYITESNYSISGESSRLSAPHLRNLPERLVGLIAGYSPDRDESV